MKNLFIFPVLLFTISLQLRAQPQDELEISLILKEQTISWNKGDLNKFMKGYWNNDSLIFVGSSGVRYGYENALGYYKNTYSDAEKMGKLSLEILKIEKLSNQYYFVLGKWFLKRVVNDKGGHYTLLFKKIRGRWLIIADHSS